MPVQLRKYRDRLYKLLYLIFFIDVLIGLVFLKSDCDVARKRARVRQPSSQSKFSVLSCFLHNIYHELQTKRLSVGQNALSIRRVFWANIRFAKLFKDSGSTQVFDRNAVMWKRSLVQSILEVQLEFNSRAAVEEGDFRLILKYNGTGIHFLTFSLVPGSWLGVAQGDVILVGGNQGCLPKHSEIRSRATRVFHDIAAKDTLMLSLIGMAKAISSPILVFVGVEKQAGNIFNPKFDDYKSSMIELYDNFWESYGAKDVAGFFVLNTDHILTEKSAPLGRNKGRKIRKRQIKNYIIEATNEHFKKSLKTNLGFSTNYNQDQ